MKKILLFIAALAAAIALGTGGAYALGNDWGTYDGYGRGMQNERQDAVQSAAQPYICNVPGCTQNNPHSHDYCTVSDCGQMTWCEHDDIIYNNNRGGNRFGYGRCRR